MSYRTQTQERSSRSITLFIVVALLAAIFPALHPTTAVHAEGEPASYIILAKTTLPDDLAQKISDAGGTLTSTMSEIGVAVAVSTDPNFAANAGKIKGIQSVTRDVSVKWVTGQDFAWTGQDFAWTGQDFTWTGQSSDGSAPAAAQLPDLSFLQWNMAAISAPQAHTAGSTGQGVRVAVLDAGFELTHPDFLWFDYSTNPPKRVFNIDANAGANFVISETLAYSPSLALTSHATHIAGIIAAADNGFGVTGVAPEATIVPVKVLHDDTNLGSPFEWIIDGIMYAAELEDDQAVQVINMSLGAALPRNGYCVEEDDCVNANEISELVNAMKRATDYASKQGITIVAAAGNVFPGDPTQDMDLVGNLIFLPADLPDVLTISATGPVLGTDVDQPAFYTRYGQSFVDFAAPGGNSDIDFFIDFFETGCEPDEKGDLPNPLCTSSFLYPNGTLELGPEYR